MLLDLTLPSLGDTMRAVKRGFNAWYRDLGVDAFCRDNLLFPLSVIVARVLAQFYLQTREQASQATPFGATGANLDAWLDLVGVTLPVATAAELTVTVTGESATIPAGTQFAAIDGVKYTSDSVVNFGTPEESINVGVTAEEVGASGNRAVGDTLELQVLIDDVQPTAVVVSLDTAGGDEADDAAKVSLLQAAYSKSNTSGTVGDYRSKALGQDTQLREVFIVEAGKGAGTLAIFPTNALGAGQEDYEVVVSSAAQITALQTFFDDPTVRKVNDRPFVLALTLDAQTFDVTIVPNTADTQASVTAALGERLSEDYTAAGYTIANSEISSAIGNATGVTSHVLNDVNGGGASADVTASFGTLATLGVITFS